MKLAEIIKIADRSYPDGMIQQAFNAYKNADTFEEERVGDGLAEFIVRELADAYDSKASKKDQLAEAVRVMDRATEELQVVSKALYRINN